VPEPVDVRELEEFLGEAVEQVTGRQVTGIDRPDDVRRK
jgi:hypothetical protein